MITESRRKLIEIDAKTLKSKLPLEKIITEVYHLSKAREIHPCRHSKQYTREKKWYPAEIFLEHMDDVRAPTYNYPFSYLLHCRTKKFISNLFAHYKIKTLEQGLKLYNDGVYIPISNAEDFILFGGDDETS